MTARRYFSRVALLMLALSLMGGVSWLWSLRVDPASIPQTRLHRMGTASHGVVMAPLPSERRVIIDVVQPWEVERLARGYLPRWLGGVPTPEITGYFDPASGEIHITGEVARMEAMAPVAWLQGGFRHALRHEYGHALLDEWLRKRAGPDAAALVPEIGQDEPAPPGDVPSELAPLMRDYRAEPERYGSSYYTSAFTEYFAESYARFIEGKSIPAATRRFFDALAKSTRS